MKLCNIIKNDVAAIFGGYKSLYTPLVYAPGIGKVAELGSTEVNGKCRPQHVVVLLLGLRSLE